MTAITYERLGRAKQNLVNAMGVLDQVDMQRHYSTQVSDLEAIARDSPVEEQKRMMHQIRQYKELVPEIGYKEAYEVIFENGWRVRG